MDGTCSMSLLFIKCKTRVKEILRRVGEVLVAKNVTSGFVQFVVYRNYSSLEKDLLVVSEWSRDPQALFEFIDKMEVSGGVGGTEAIEVAFWHVNLQGPTPMATGGGREQETPDLSPVVHLPRLQRCRREERYHDAATDHRKL